MIIYFLLIGFASLMVGVEFLIETQDPQLRENLITNFERYANNEIEIDEVFIPIEKLRNKALLMIAIIMSVMIIVLMMFIKKITEPLQHMIDVSGEISKGDLSQTITLHSKNELSELGNVINEMSSNLQEILLLSKNLCATGNAFADTASEILNKETPVPEEISDIRNSLLKLKKELDTFSEIIEYHNFYTVEK